MVPSRFPLFLSHTNRNGRQGGFSVPADYITLAWGDEEMGKQ